MNCDPLSLETTINYCDMNCSAVYRTKIGFTFMLLFVLSVMLILLMEIMLINIQNDNYINLIIKNRPTEINKNNGAGNKSNKKNFDEFSGSSSDNIANNFNLTAMDGVWQSVVGSRFKFYVYAAYADKRIFGYYKLIRIIGIAKTRFPDKVRCWIRFKNNKSIILPAYNEVIRENWSLKYSALFILCPLHSNATIFGIPLTVSILATDKLPPSNNLIVNNYVYLPEKTAISEDNVDSIAVCVKPLHFNFDRNVQLMEFIEMNRILGVNHFTFYNNTMGPTVDCLLKSYMENGIVEVKQWHGLSIKSQIEIRTEGMFAAMNDCLYRNMYKFDYLMFIDLDEIIVPRLQNTLLDLLKWINKQTNNAAISGYSFQNAFFYLQWDDDIIVKKLSDSSLEKKLTHLKKTRRLTKVHAHRQRSKYICKPQDVVETGNHFIWQFMQGHGMVNVPGHIALLHHYRICEFGGNDCVKSNSTVDRSTHRYWNFLIGNITQRWIPLIDKCKLP